MSFALAWVGHLRFSLEKNPMKINGNIMSVVKGGKCGSTYIDRNLHALLSNRFGRAFDELPWGQKGPGSKFMTCFEMVKRNFGLNDEREGQELGPLRLDIPESEYYDEGEFAAKLT